MNSLEYPNSHSNYSCFSAFSDRHVQFRRLFEGNWTYRTCFCNKKPNQRISKPVVAELMHRTWMSQCPGGWGQVLVLHPICAGFWHLQLSNVGWSHPSSHKAVVVFSNWKMQWAGHGLKHLHEEEAAYGPTNRSRPLGTAGSALWEAAGSPWGAGGSCLAVSAALAVGEMHWVVLLPWALVHWVPSDLPFPSPGWSLRGSTLVFDVEALVFFLSEVLRMKFVSEIFLLHTLFFNSLCQQLICGKENFLFCLMLSCWVSCSILDGRGA